MGETTNAAKHCWKRIAFILGHALIGKFRVLTDQDLPDYVRESLGDALKPCDGDEEFLEDGKVIREWVFQLVKPLPFPLVRTERITFDLIDNYEEAINEIKRIKGIVGRRSISLAEAIYVLGLTFIVSEAIKLGKGVGENDVDEVLHVLSLSTEAMDSVEIINRWRDISRGPLSPLFSSSKAPPHRELMLLAKILSINVPHNYVSDSAIEYFLENLDIIIKDYPSELANKAWPLVFATQAYSELLRKYAGVLKKNKKLKKTANKLKGILNDLKSISHNLYTVALAYALIPLTEVGIDLGIDGRDVFNELSSMLDRVSELMRDRYFMDYVKANYVGDVGEEHVKNVILHAMSHLGNPLAERYLKEAKESFNDGELGEALKLLNEVAMIKQRLGRLNEYLMAQGGALCIEAIELLMNFNNEKYSELIGKYKQLLNQAELNQAEKGRVSAPQILGQYLVLLALGGDANSVNRISELIDKYRYELNKAEPVSILTKLMLKALLKPVVKQGSKLDEELEVDEGEIINTFTRTDYLDYDDLQDNLMATISGSDLEGRDMKRIRKEWIVYFQKGVEELKEEARIDENRAKKINKSFGNFLNKKLNDESSAQLLVSMDPIARFALMLNALINDEIDLAKAHALLGGVVKRVLISPNSADVVSPSKLYTRLFLDAYDNCCDLSSNDFKLALTKLYLSTIFEHTLLEAMHYFS
jgi:hypothetical protein